MRPRIRYLLPILALSGSAAIVGVTGMGSFPVSQNTLAFWLLRADSTPLVMVYYHGPAKWHDTEWKVDSQFTDSAVGSKEEDNLRHLVINLGSDVPRSKIVPRR